MPGPLPTSPVHERRYIPSGKPLLHRGTAGKKGGPPPSIRQWWVATFWLGKSSGWLISGAFHLVLAALLAQAIFENAGTATESGIDGGWQLGDAAAAGFDAPVLTGPLVPASGESGGGSGLSELAPLEMTPVTTGLNPGAGGSGLSPLAGIGAGTGTGDGNGVGGGGAPGIGFFGTSSRASSVVFVVDMSGSMEGWRFARAKQELVRSIQPSRDRDRGMSR